MILQPPQARVCSGSRSLKASSHVAQMEAEIAQLNEALRAFAADNAGDENTGVANPRLRVVKVKP
jgi:outer membrane murein-binding lipoprotein Lpp